MCGFVKSKWLLILATIGVALWIPTMKRNKLCSSKMDLDGKTVVVTGGNTGIGYETALGIAKQNAKVIIACRNEQKAKKAIKDIKLSSGKTSVDYLIVDLADMADIRRAAKELMRKEDRLDILINNAAILTTGKTKDGFDTMFAVNHLGGFLLTNLLMPLMRKTSQTDPVRIINVSSLAYRNGIIDFDNLNPDITEDCEPAVAFSQYSNTKLMNIYFTSELDARLKEEFKDQRQTITTYSLHPGIINTNLGHEYFKDKGIRTRVFRNIFYVLFNQPVADTAQTSICCAVEEGIEKYSGGYFSNVQPTELADHARNPEIGRKLWAVSEHLSGVKWQDST